MRHTLRKILFVFGYIALVGNLALVVVLITWLLQPYTLPRIVQPIEILNANNEIAVGEPIQMRLIIDKHQELKTVAQTPRIECVSGNLVTLSGEAKDLPVGKYTIDSDRYLLPPKVLVGDSCQFIFATTFQINPIKSVKSEWFSENFIVKE